MVSLNPNPPESFYLDPMGMALPGLGSFSTPTTATGSTTTTTTTTTSSPEDPSKKFRKPYTITKSRESWTEAEHDKFLEALQLFDRDWKKIEAFVGSKTVIQIRSHAQKYFMKVQKSGANEHLPPPRPKRKAAHRYPQKASKNVPVLSQVNGCFQASGSVLEPGFIQATDRKLVTSDNSVETISLSHVAKGDVRSVGPVLGNNCCSSSESTPRARQAGEMDDQGNHVHSLRVLPDFAQVYSFIGSVFDPSSTGHLQTLKKMDQIDVETVLLLMRNLSINLTSPDFEDHRRLLLSYEIKSEQDYSDGANVIPRQNGTKDVTLHGLR